jgi:hypothetical protein
MTRHAATLATTATGPSAPAFPPLSRDGPVDNFFRGLKLLGTVAVWNSIEERRNLPFTSTLPLPGPEERNLFVIKDEGSGHLTVATEAGCTRNELGLPVSLSVLSPDDTDRPVRMACCTAAG